MDAVGNLKTFPQALFCFLQPAYVPERCAASVQSLIVHHRSVRIPVQSLPVTRSGSFSCATGAPKNAMISSPMNLSIVPS
jgi:hypothetical protein